MQIQEKMNSGTEYLLLFWIDLVWQTPKGYVIVDHKSYLGQVDTVQQHCTAFVPQLNVYADCLEKALGEKPLALLVHLPMIGQMVEIGRRGSAFSESERMQLD